MLLILSCFAFSAAEAQAPLTIDKDGNVGIKNDSPHNLFDINGNRTGNHPTNMALYVTPNQPGEARFAEFRNTDATQGIGISYNSIYAAGDAPNQDIYFSAKGVQGNLLFQTNNADRLKIDGNGNVAIGNTSGAINNKLEIGGNLHMDGNPIYFRGGGTTDKADVIQWQGGNNDRMIMAGWNGAILGTTSGKASVNGSITPVLLANSNGWVGIGTMDPKAFLDIDEKLDNGAYGAVFGRLTPGNDQGNGTFLGVKGNNGGNGQKSFSLEYNRAGKTVGSINFYHRYKYEVDGNQSCISIGTGSNNEQVFINEDGYMGIGTKEPRWPIEVQSFSVNPPRTTDKRETVSIFAEKAILTMDRMITYSDRRIKKDFKLSNNASDLDILNRIKVTTYKMIDSAKFGREERKGVVAQQIEEVMPEAIVKTQEFIPGTFSKPVKISQNGQTVSLVMSNPHHFVNGDIIKLFVNNVMEQKQVTVISANTFSIEATAANYTDIFVYGKRVSDLKAVDYDMLFTLNISATQQLSKEVNALKADNALIKSAYEKLAAKIEKLEASVGNNPNTSATNSDRK